MYNDTVNVNVCIDSSDVTRHCRLSIFTPTFKTTFPFIPDPDILNEINWSKKLEEVFLENRKNYPKIYWQSFGSQKGVLRIYPLAR